MSIRYSSCLREIFILYHSTIRKSNNDCFKFELEQLQLQERLKTHQEIRFGAYVRVFSDSMKQFGYKHYNCSLLLMPNPHAKTTHRLGTLFILIINIFLNLHFSKIIV